MPTVASDNPVVSNASIDCCGIAEGDGVDAGAEAVNVTSVSSKDVRSIDNIVVVINQSIDSVLPDD